MDEPKIKTHLIKVLFTSFLLAILLKAGFHIPFLTTFIAVITIYVMHVVTMEIETTALKGMKFTMDMAVGIVIFLALRLFAGAALNLYPVDTFADIDKSGGLWDGILLGRNASKVFLWEVGFAVIAGSLTTDYVRKKGRIIVNIVFVISTLILTLYIAFPRYTATWPDRDTASVTLINHGVLGASTIAVRGFLCGKPTPPPPPAVSVTPVVVEFPSSGEGYAYATNEIGINAWLNPMVTYLRATGPARYVFVENPEIFFDDIGPIGKNRKKWFKMPYGKYLVYSLNGDKIYFRWWQ